MIFFRPGVDDLCCMLIGPALNLHSIPRPALQKISRESFLKYQVWREEQMIVLITHCQSLKYQVWREEQHAYDLGYPKREDNTKRRLEDLPAPDFEKSIWAFMTNSS